MTYRIKNWNEHFEVAQKQARLIKASWVAVPNKHDGKSFRRLMKLPDGCQIYGAWILILSVASKCPERGVLADADGPLTCQDISDKTGAPLATIERAMKVLASPEVGWILTESVGRMTEIAERLTETTATGQDRTVQDSTSHREPQTDAVAPKDASLNSKKKTNEQKQTANVGKHFCELYKRYRGSEYKITGRDAGALRDLNKIIRPEEVPKLKAAIDAFLHDQDRFLGGSGYTLSNFATRVNKYLSEVAKQVETKPDDPVGHDPIGGMLA